jgi:helix-turn-helix protein
VPDDLGDFFSATVTVAFEQGGSQYAAAVEAEDGTIQKFYTVLFKALLNSTEVTVKHPARVGGRVTGEEFTPAQLFLDGSSVEFRRPENGFTVNLAHVTGFERLEREIAGSNRPVLAVKHMTGGRSVLSLAALPSARKMNVFGRYLRLEYSDVMAELDDVELGEAETELLVAVYSAGDADGLPLADILDKEASEVTMLLNQLRRKELIVDTDEGTKLTPMGRVVVNNHLEEVNE